MPKYYGHLFDQRIGIWTNLISIYIKPEPIWSNLRWKYNLCMIRALFKQNRKIKRQTEQEKNCIISIFMFKMYEKKDFFSRSIFKKEKYGNSYCHHYC